MATLPAKPAMKDRILETADRLFYLQGIRAVGVDTIAAEIGISKRTLYNHFPSKDALISAYLARRFVAPRAFRQVAGRADSRHLRFAGAALFGEGFSRLPVRQCGRRTRQQGPVGPKDRDRIQGKPPPLVSRPAGAARRHRCGSAGDAARAAGRRLDRAGSRAQRSRDGAGGKGSRDGAAEECGGEGGRRRRYTHAEETPVLVGRLKAYPHVVPAKRRDPYAVAFQLGDVVVTFLLQSASVVMGPCVRRDDDQTESGGRGSDNGRPESDRQRLRLQTGARGHAALRRWQPAVRHFLGGHGRPRPRRRELRRLGRQGSANAAPHRPHLPRLFQHQANHLLRGAAAVRGRQTWARRPHRKIHSAAWKSKGSAPWRDLARRHRAGQELDHHPSAAEPQLRAELRLLRSRHGHLQGPQRARRARPQDDAG